MITVWIRTAEDFREDAIVTLLLMLNAHVVLDPEICWVPGVGSAAPLLPTLYVPAVACVS